MGIVYRLAARVVVWLGPEENDSDRAMTLIADLSDASKAPGAVEQLKSPTDPPFPPVFRLILRPWFDRLWIRQEIRLGNSQSMVLVGTQTLLWSQFCPGLKRLWLVMWQETSKHTELILRLGSLEGLLFAPPFLDFSNLRQHCGRTLCRDPRDRIYAVLSLLHGADRLEIRPDYTRSVKQVYLDVLRQHVCQSRDVGFLASCEWLEEPSLPSWVPDFKTRAKGLGEVLPEFHRAHGLVFGSDTAVLNGGRLRTTGGITNAEEAQIPLILGNTLLKKYARGPSAALFSGSFGHLPHATLFEDLGSVVECLRRLHGENRGSLTEQEQDILTPLLRSAEFYLGTGQILHSEKGDGGLAGGLPRPGDGVYVILGCALPMVLREEKEAAIEWSAHATLTATWMARRSSGLGRTATSP
ncbi:heterokaryon incompatibility protein-domain-containing protein [Apiospora arundinis]